MAMTILIVDDSATMLMSLKTGLTISGFKVESANCGQAALDKLKSGIKPDLILTDINMPGMTGLELIGKIRALSSFRFTPILTLTTESETSKRLGATGWLVKPLSGNDLVKVIKQVLPGA